MYSQFSSMQRRAFNINAFCRKIKAVLIVNTSFMQLLLGYVLKLDVFPYEILLFNFLNAQLISLILVVCNANLLKRYVFLCGFLMALYVIICLIHINYIRVVKVVGLYLRIKTHFYNVFFL